MYEGLAIPVGTERQVVSAGDIADIEASFTQVDAEFAGGVRDIEGSLTTGLKTVRDVVGTLAVGLKEAEAPVVSKSAMAELAPTNDTCGLTQWKGC